MKVRPPQLSILFIIIRFQQIIKAFLLTFCKYYAA